MIVVTYDPEVSENADVGFRIRDGVPTKENYPPLMLKVLIFLLNIKA